MIFLPQASLHDIIHKNMDKIKKPRSGNAENLYWYTRITFFSDAHKMTDEPMCDGMGETKHLCVRNVLKWWLVMGGFLVTNPRNVWWETYRWDSLHNYNSLQKFKERKRAIPRAVYECMCIFECMVRQQC